jgi:hypothetical protein
MKNRIFSNPMATVLFYSGCIVLFGYLILKNRDFLNILSSHNIGTFGIVLAFMLLHFILLGSLNALTFGFGKLKIGLGKGCKLVVFHTAGNYLPFSGGLIAKGLLLKRDFNIGYMQYTAISVYMFICTIVISGVFGLSSSLILVLENRVLLFGFALMISTGVFLFLPLSRIPILSRYVSFDQLHQSGIFFRSILLRALLIYGAVYLLAAMRLVYSFSIIGLDISYANALLMICGVILTRLVALTPGSMGIREGMVAALAHLSGIDYELAFIATGIDRLAEILIVFGIGGVISLRGYFTN